MVRPAPGGEVDVQFPYSHLKQYLKDRHLDYLADLVRWSGDDWASQNRRAKHFINAIKIRLEFSHPEKVGAIARNEGHVRLSSSMWYVSEQLRRISYVGLCAGVAAPIAFGVTSWSLWPNPYFWIPLLPLSTLVAFTRVRTIIERVLHYQREREVLFILETAYWANQKQPSANLFDGLS